MPVLEDTVDFKVATLNDLLDADVKKGVPVAADDKYKRWAFLSTGLAGMLLVALIVALVTGGGDDGGGSKSTEVLSVPAGMGEVNLSGGTGALTFKVGDDVTLYDEAQVVANGKVLGITESPGGFEGKTITKLVKIAVPTEDVTTVNGLDASGKKLKIKSGTQLKPTTTTTAAPSTTPTPIEPAPATTPTS